jgi:release factor glutamine methyltransferase
VSAVGATRSWRDLWRETSELLADPIRARWLCEVASGNRRSDFDAGLDEPATERMVAHLDEMLTRLRGGEPLQYVLGEWSFRHVELALDRRVLIPRPETEQVAGAAIDIAAEFGPVRTVVDLGTGSGAIGLAMADELPIDGTTVWLTDVSLDALDVARANVAGLGRAGRNVRIGHGSWFDALPARARFDVVVSNPPYVEIGSQDLAPEVAEWEPAPALLGGADGLDAIRRIVAGAPPRVRPAGGLVLEIGADQGDRVAALLTAAGFSDVEIRADDHGRDRVAVARRPVTMLAAGDLVVRHLVNRIDDYALLLRWLTTDEVLEWYHGRDRRFDLAEVLREYGPGSELERDGTEPAIVELGGRPVGYVQVYELTECAAEFGLADGRGVWSLDLFVGEPDLHGRGIGRRLVRAVADHLLDARGARRVVIMPYPDNERAVRSYEAAGFVRDGLVRGHELHEGVMRDGLRMVYAR